MLNVAILTERSITVSSFVTLYHSSSFYKKCQKFIMTHVQQR